MAFEGEVDLALTSRETNRRLAGGATRDRRSRPGSSRTNDLRMVNPRLFLVRRRPA